MLLAIVWFATVGVRENAAREFDASADTALAGEQYRTAYRKAEFADALRPTEARQLTLGSLAYLNGDYQAAQRQFARVGGAEKTRGLIGLMAAAGQAGDDRAYQRAKRKLGTPTDASVVSQAAFAAIVAGDLDGARGLIGTSRAKEISDLARTIANLNDSAASERFLDQAQPAASFGSDPYGRFSRELSDLPENADTTLVSAVAAAKATTSSGAKKVIAAHALFKLERYQAAESLAEAAVQAEPLYRDGWQVLAACQITLDQTKQAGRSLKTALDLDPASGYTWFLKSQLAEKQKNSEDAADFREKAKTFGYPA